MVADNKKTALKRSTERKD